MRLSSGLALLVGLCACQRGEQEDTPAIDGAEALRTLTRASLDLRGTRPTDEEIAAIEAHPTALDATLDSFVQDERFPERVVDLYNQIYLTRTEAMNINVGPLGITANEPFYQIVGEEPLRLVAQIAADDLPYTQVVTADWSVVNEALAAVYPTDYPAGGTGWQKIHYADGRPAGGVLATNGLWWRYTSTNSNNNRGRANALSRILLCEDFLARDVSFDASVFLLDQDAQAAALGDNPVCQNCHSALDPLASHLFGFFWYNYTSSQEATRYHAGRESLWVGYTGISPAYFGTPTQGFAELGPRMAADPRLLTCAVEQAWRLMLRRAPTLDDQPRLTALRASFIDGGLTLRSLYRALVDEPAYRGTGDDGASRLVQVEQLASEIEDLTGFRWIYRDEDMMRSDREGLHLIGGGVDGVSQTVALTKPTPGVVLVQEAVAEAASAYAVAREVDLDPSERRLFTEIDFSETPDSDPGAIQRQLQALHLRLYGTRVDADSDEIAAGVALWRLLYDSEGDAAAVWQGVLTAMLRDPAFILD